MHSNHKPDDLAIMMLVWFDDLKSLDDSTKAQLRNKVNTYQAQLLNIREARVRSQYILLKLFQWFWRIGIVFPLAFLIIYNQVTTSFWEWIGAYGIIFTAQYLFYRITLQLTGQLAKLMVLPLDNPFSTYGKFLQAFLLINTVMSFAYSYFLFLVTEQIGSTGVQLHLLVLAAILINPLIIFGSQLLFLLFAGAISWLIGVTRDRKHTTAAIASFLIHALYLVEIYPGPNAHENYKPFIASLLESVAKLVELELPNQLNTGHRTQFASIRKMFSGIANGIREYENEVLISGITVNTTLAPRLGTLLLHILSGNWDQLERQEQVDINIEAKKIRVREIFSTLTWPALVLILAFVLDKTQAVGEFSVVFYIIGGLVMSVSLFLLDPRHTEKLYILEKLVNYAEAFKKVSDASEKHKKQ